MKSKYAFLPLKAEDKSSERKYPSEYTLPSNKYEKEETLARGVWRWITRVEEPDRSDTNIKNIGSYGFNNIHGVLSALTIKGVRHDFWSTLYYISHTCIMFFHV